MPDILHFEADAALDAMLQVFWRQGFKHTTTKQLAQAAGISESSLFNTFGSKRDVFQRCVERYRAATRRMNRMLEREDSALGGIRDYWEFICNYACDESDGRGCLITNASVEQSEDPEMSRLLKRIHRESESAYRQTLDRAIELGEIREDADTEALAQFLLHSTQGIRVLARLRPSKAKMQNIASLTLSVLDQYRTN